MRLHWASVFDGAPEIAVGGVKPKPFDYVVVQSLPGGLSILILRWEQ